MNTDEQKNAYLLEAFKDVGQAMKELREHNGLTIEEAAERIGRTPGKVVAMEKGVLFNNVVNLCKTAEAMGGQLAILPTDNPGLKHCEFISTSPNQKFDTPPIKKAIPTAQRGNIAFKDALDVLLQNEFFAKDAVIGRFDEPDHHVFAKPYKGGFLEIEFIGKHILTQPGWRVDTPEQLQEYIDHLSHPNITIKRGSSQKS